MSFYANALTSAMTALARDPRVVFVGQGCRFPGTFMSTTLANVPMEKRIEMPVAEEMQLGICIGMALTGLVPVSIYPRWNFLLLAANQLVGHLDKMKAHVIVRVGVGSEKPLHPGDQHVGDFSNAFASMCKNTVFARLEDASDIVPAYMAALERNGPTVLTEIADLYPA